MSLETTDLAMYLMHEYVQDNLEHIHTDTFTQEMMENVLSLLACHVDHDLNDDILAAYQLFTDGRTSLHCPLQENTTDRLTTLRAQFQPPQRTPEW